MFETPYYHELIKKTTIGFGALFSQIKVIRRNPASGVQAQVVSVPIAFGPKEKILTRIDQDPSLTGHTYITLPRMAFEITGYNYDTTRMVNRNNKIQCYQDQTVTAIYSPVPYNIEFSLYILTKGTEDGLAIIEQILPLFTPEYSFTVNAIPELNISQDIPVVLTSISVSDDYEGDFAIRRLVTHTLNFTAKINLFGNLQTSGLITRVDADIKKFENYTATMDEDGNIVVDVWREMSRESLFPPMVASVVASATTIANMDPTNPAVSTNALVSVNVSANMKMLNPLAASIDVTADAFVETFNALFANINVGAVIDSPSLDVVYGGEVSATSITGFVFQNVEFNYSVDGFVDPTFPDLTLVRGQTYDFNFTNVTSSHPIALRLSSGNTAAVPGTIGNDASSGVYGTNVTYQVPLNAPSSIVYQCVFHSGMNGVINIID